MHTQYSIVLPCSYDRAFTSDLRCARVYSLKIDSIQTLRACDITLSNEMFVSTVCAVGFKYINGVGDIERTEVSLRRLPCNLSIVGYNWNLYACLYSTYIYIHAYTHTHIHIYTCTCKRARE